jgi:hypothetical protein
MHRTAISMAHSSDHLKKDKQTGTEQARLTQWVHAQPELFRLNRMT